MRPPLAPFSPHLRGIAREAMSLGPYESSRTPTRKWYCHGLSLILTIPNSGSVSPGSNLGCYLGRVSQDEAFYVVEDTQKHGGRGQIFAPRSERWYVWYWLASIDSAARR